MNRKNILLVVSFCLGAVLHLSCNKIDSFLDEKGRLSDVRPASLKDFQSILNNTAIMNTQYPGIGLVGSDNYYLTLDNFNSTRELEQNAYLWKKDIFTVTGSGEWKDSYQRIEYCNIVLDGLKDIKSTELNQQQINGIRGQALFFRAYTYYMLSQIFCKAYSPKTSEQDLGLVIRQGSDINDKSNRSTVEETYQNMINDLKKSIELLPSALDINTRPNKTAALAELAKVYFSMGNYQEALKYATECLNGYNTLLDFNDNSIVNPLSTYRFPQFLENREIIFYAKATGYQTIFNYPSSKGIVDSTLYKLYDDNDLRKSIFYSDDGNGNVKIRGCYSGDGYNFSGIAVNEILLIASECEDRLGNISDALNDLNTLLVKRYKTGTYQYQTEQNQSALLNIILTERRKELPFTGQLRWEDLRRLNLDSKFADTLTRVIDGRVYELLPNSPKYVYPIPDDEVELSNIPQNDR